MKTTFDAMTEYLEGLIPLSAFLEIARDNKASEKTISELLDDAELDCICDAVEFGRMTYGQRDLVEKRIDNIREFLSNNGDEEVFREWICNNKTAGKLLKLLHDLIDGKKGNNALIYIAAAVKVGVIRKPTFEAFCVDFPDVVKAKSQYNEYANPEKNNFSTLELDAIGQYFKTFIDRK